MCFKKEERKEKEEESPQGSGEKREGRRGRGILPPSVQLSLLQRGERGEVLLLKERKKKEKKGGERGSERISYHFSLSKKEKREEAGCGN